MLAKFSRRDFIRFGAVAVAGLAISPLEYFFTQFEDANLVRVATSSISVYSEPNDKSRIVAQLFRDELIPVYAEVNAGTPVYNPIWYRVWGGYVHRGRLQKVKTIFNEPLPSFPEGTRQLAELTVPFSQAMRYTKTYGWQPNLRLYYQSVHWIDRVEEGSDGGPWYRIFDELVGFPYHVQAIHLRPIPTEIGNAFHGTYWHNNFGAPMSRGCVNMRVEEARWLFRWVYPPHVPEKISNRGSGTLVVITP